jgi:putative sterol carrier protein
MPLAFDSEAAAGAEATVQFHLEGTDGGDFWLRVAGGECESSPGVAASPDLTVRAPSSVWLRIVRGELDGARALLDGQYSVEGDAALLMRFGEWFPGRR